MSSGLLKNRPRHLRILALVLVPILALASPIPGRAEWLSAAAESLGILCLVVCLVCRGWASVYVAGRKNQELVTGGPYSVVRNPLYVFSFIGVVGIGLISEMMTLLVVAVVGFAVAFHLVVLREETYLAGLHGEAYTAYRRAVPRWFPRFSAWRDTAKLDVEPRQIGLYLRDSSLFFLAFLFFKACELLRNVGALPTLIQIP